MEFSTIEARNPESIPTEQTVVELREGGMSIKNIHDATGVPERKIKDLIKGISKPRKPKKVCTKTQTPLTKAVERVFSLAKRQYGIRDYELRNIMQEEYGSKWDTSAITIRAPSSGLNKKRDSGQQKKIAMSCS